MSLKRSAGGSRRGTVALAFQLVATLAACTPGDDGPMRKDGGAATGDAAVSMDAAFEQDAGADAATPDDGGRPDGGDDPPLYAAQYERLLGVSPDGRLVLLLGSQWSSSDVGGQGRRAVIVYDRTTQGFTCLTEVTAGEALIDNFDEAVMSSDARFLGLSFLAPTLPPHRRYFLYDRELAEVLPIDGELTTTAGIQAVNDGGRYVQMTAGVFDRETNQLASPSDPAVSLGMRKRGRYLESEPADHPDSDTFSYKDLFLRDALGALLWTSRDTMRYVEGFLFAADGRHIVYTGQHTDGTFYGAVYDIEAQTYTKLPLAGGVYVTTASDDARYLVAEGFGNERHLLLDVELGTSESLPDWSAYGPVGEATISGNGDVLVIGRSAILDRKTKEIVPMPLVSLPTCAPIPDRD